MNTSDSFHLFESLNLLIISHHTTFHQHNIETVLNEFEVNPYFTKGINVLIDMRKAEIMLDADEIREISKLVFSKLSDKEIEKFAILVDTPQMNKVVEFVKAYQQSSKYQVFPILEAAMHWLKIPSDRKEQIEIKLNFLQNH